VPPDIEEQESGLRLIHVIELNPIPNQLIESYKYKIVGQKIQVREVCDGSLASIGDVAEWAKIFSKFRRKRGRPGASTCQSDKQNRYV